MFWRNQEPEQGVIYVLMNDDGIENAGTWQGVADTWDETQPIDSGLVAPPDRYVPGRGFGKVWRAMLDGDTPPPAIGWALETEQGLEGANTRTSSARRCCSCPRRTASSCCTRMGDGGRSCRSLVWACGSFCREGVWERCIAFRSNRCGVNVIVIALVLTCVCCWDIVPDSTARLRLQLSTPLCVRRGKRFFLKKAPCVRW